MNNNNNPNNLSIILSLFKHIKKKRKLQLVFVIFIMLVSGLAELFTIASIVPFLSVLIDPGIVFRNQIVISIFTFLNLSSDINKQLLVTLVFCLITIFAALIRIFNLWLNTRMSTIIASDLATEAYEITLSLPYTYHLSVNSSEIVNIISFSVCATSSCINLILQLLTSIIIIISIGGVLLSINLKVGIILSTVIIVSYALITFSFKKRLISNSKIEFKFREKTLQIIQEGVRSIRDIIIYRAQSLFVQDYDKTDRTMRLRQSQSILISGFPRFGIESIGLVSIALLSYFLTINNLSPNTIIPTLGAFALGAQRLLPSFQTLYSSWSSINARIHKIESVLRQLEMKTHSHNLIINNNLTNLKFTKSIQLNNISYKYPNSSKYVLNDLSLNIRRGEIVGIIGQSGSGKSTLVNILIGLLNPSCGKLIIDDLDVHQANSSQLLSEWQNLISWVPQSIYLRDATIAENIAFGSNGKNINYKLVKQASYQAQISGFIETLEEKYDTRVGEDSILFSGGQKQRIAIARALYRKHSVLILDEATSALDQNTEKLLLESIIKNNSDTTIIMITHRSSTLDNCDKIVTIDNGRIT